MTTHIIPWMNVTVNIIKNTIEVYHGNEKMYEYKGKFIFRILDNNNFVILEKDPSNTLNKCDNHQRIIFFRKDEKGKIIANKYCIKQEKIVFDKDLLHHEEVIIPGIYKDFVYNYEYGIVISDFFTRISYNKNSELFLVEEDFETSYGTVTLKGILNVDGFLLNEEMYCEMLQEEFYINPLDIPNSFYHLRSKLETLMKRKTSKDYFTNLLNYERDCYLTRKRKIPKQNSSSR